MSNMKPCINPGICGVQMHRSDTECRGQLSTSSLSSIMTGGGQLGSPQQPSASTASGTDSFSAMPAPEGTIDGGVSGDVRMAFRLENGDKPYDYVDQPVYASIVLPDGREVLAYDTGDECSYTFSDGETRRSWIMPGDKDNYDMSASITSEQFDVLESTFDAAGEFDAAQDMSEDPREYRKVTREELTESVKLMVADSSKNR